MYKKLIMNRNQLFSMAVAAMLVAACSTSKKTATTTAPSPAASVVKKARNGVYVPGNEELTAFQAKHPEATLASLNEGYSIYVGVCTNCHKPKAIYSRSEASWPGIIDDMAIKAKISDAQKEAVLNYVLAIKATAPK